MIKPDKILFYSKLPQYIELEEATGSFTISGIVGPASVLTFSTTILFNSLATWCDVYAKNGNTNKKAIISSVNIPAVYQYAGSEIAQQLMTYSSGSITIRWDITNNTGAGILLTTQTISLQVIPYRLPI